MSMTTPPPAIRHRRFRFKIDCRVTGLFVAVLAVLQLVTTAAQAATPVTCGDPSNPDTVYPLGLGNPQDPPALLVVVGHSK